MRELVLAVDALHAAAAAAGGRLHEHGPAELTGELARGREVVDLRTGDDREPCRDGVPAGLQLVSERVELRRRRPHEHDSRGIAGEGELAVLGEEAVAGVDGVGTDDQCGLHDGVDAQVREGRADADRAVGKAGGDRVEVDLGGGQHRLDAERAAGPDDARRYLAAIRHEEAAHVHDASGSMRISRA